MLPEVVCLLKLDIKDRHQMRFGRGRLEGRARGRDGERERENRGGDENFKDYFD